MAFTKILGPGIHTLANFHSHNINSSGIITATKFVGPLGAGVTGDGANFAGIVTCTGLDVNGNGDISGNLTVDGNVSIGGTITYTDVTNIDAIGIITAQSTVSIADSIVHTGNTDTSIRFPSDDIFTVETAGSERFRIESNGWVGVGHTGSDFALFDVYSGNGVVSGSKYTARIRNGHSSGGNGLIINAGHNDTHTSFKVKPYNSSEPSLYALGGHTVGIASRIEHLADTNTYFGFPGLQSVATDTFHVVTAGVERLRIRNDGNILVTNDLAVTGVATFASQVNFDDAITVDGSVGIADSIIHLGNTDTSIRFPSDDTVRVETGGTTRLTITDSSTTSAVVINANAGVNITDNQYLNLGDSSGSDARLWHDGTGGGHTYLFSYHSSGVLKIADDTNVILGKTTNYNYINCTPTTTELFAGNSKKLATTSTGVTVTGEVAATQDYPTIQPTLNFNFARTKKLDPRITYARHGAASYMDEFGIIKFVNSNAPRFDHDPDTGESLGLLIEEKRTNYLSYSEEISQASNSNVTITNNNAISPDGTQNASRIVGSGSDSNQHINWSSQTVASGHFTTWSIFLKSTETSCILQFYTNTYVGGNSRLNVELADGTTGGDAVGSTWRWTVTKYPNKWWRVTWGGNGAGGAGSMHISIVPSLTSARVATSGSAVNKTYYAWGVQEEHGADQKWASSYIRTNGQKVTRGADQVTISGSEFTDFYNDLEGTFAVTHSILSDVPDGRNCYVFEVSDGGSSHVAFRYNDVNSSFANKPAFHSVYNNSLSASMNATGTYTRGEIVKGAMTAKASSFKATWNGETIQTDGSGSLFGPGSTGQLAIGRYHPTPGYELNGHIQRMMYWPKQLSSNQLVNLTS